MLVNIYTDRNIDADEDLLARFEKKVRSELDRYSERLTRVEVHLMDENANKGGADKRCTVEARAAGMRPIAASHEAEVLEVALDGALDKVRRGLSHAAGKQGHR